MNNAVILDERMPDELVSILQGDSFSPVMLPCRVAYDGPICGHPDISVFVDGNTVITNKDTFETICEQMSNSDVSYIETDGKKIPQIVRYPDDCTLNAAVCGRNLIGNLRVLDTAVLRYAVDRGYNLIHVNQGYAKCNICVVSDNALITEDDGIASACKNNGIDVLHLHTHAVQLDGYAYGFIGGASGLCDGTVYFTGNFSHTDVYDAITRFCDQYGVRTKILGSRPVYDYGSLLFIGG